MALKLLEHVFNFLKESACVIRFCFYGEVRGLLLRLAFELINLLFGASGKKIYRKLFRCSGVSVST